MNNIAVSFPPWLRLSAILFLVAGWWLLSSAFGQRDPRALPVSIIVVASEADAAQIAAQVKNGEDFGALARSKSTDPTANDSGYMGITDPANLRTELRGGASGRRARSNQRHRQNSFRLRHPQSME